MSWGLDELGDELRPVLHTLNEPLDFPVTDHDLVDLLDDDIVLVLSLLITAIDNYGDAFKAENINYQ